MNEGVNKGDGTLPKHIILCFLSQKLKDEELHPSFFFFFSQLLIQYPSFLIKTYRLDFHHETFIGD